MITNLLISILVVVFSGLAILHFYWALGGTSGLDAALPTDLNGDKVLHPSRLLTAFVGFCLLLPGLALLADSSLIPAVAPSRLGRLLISLSAVVFLLRAFGDLKYVGFFKRIVNTRFAELDTKIYSPLCLSVALGLVMYLLTTAST